MTEENDDLSYYPAPFKAPMTDTLSREQIAWIDASYPLNSLETQRLRDTALAVMDERDRWQDRAEADERYMNEWAADARRFAAERDAAQADCAQLEGENAKLQEACEALDEGLVVAVGAFDILAQENEGPGYAERHATYANDSLKAGRACCSALLSSPGRAPETQALENAQGASAAGTPPETLRGAERFERIGPYGVVVTFARDYLLVDEEDDGAPMARFVSPLDARQFWRFLTNMVAEFREQLRVREAAGCVTEGNSNAETV